MKEMNIHNNLPKYIQILYGAGVSYAIVDQIFSQWVLYYYLPPESVGLRPLLPPVFISIALVLSRFVDMVADPLVGHWSDKFNSQWGRRIPFIALGAIPLILSTIAYFYPIKSSSNIPTFIYLAITGSVFFIFYTIVGAPYNALIPEISHSRDDRLNLSTWQSLFRLFYTATAIILPALLINITGRGNTEKGIRAMVILFGLFALTGMLITVFSINEKKYSGEKESKINFIASLKSAFSNRSLIVYLVGLFFFMLGFNNLRACTNYYVEVIMGMGKSAIIISGAILFGVSGTFFYPINRLAKKVGYKKPLMFFLLLLAFFTASFNLVGRILPKSSGFIIFALMGIPVSGLAFIFPPAMLSEISAIASKKEGVNIEGVFFGIQGFFLKMSFLFSIGILPILLVLGSGTSFLDSLITKSEAVSKNGVYATTLFSSLAFLSSFVCYIFYKEEL